MYPSNNDCFKCFCTKDFENEPIEKNKNCVKISCNMEIINSESIKNECVPIYPENVCCPYSWRCPRKDDAIIPGDRNSDTKNFKCKFGKLEFEIGDSLSTGSDSCSKCKCITPPFLDCVFTPSC